MSRQRLGWLWLLVLAGTGCGNGGNGNGDPDATLCPETAPAGMEVCISFGTLEQGLGETDIGGLQMELQGEGEIVEGRAGPALRFDGTDDELTIEGFSFDGQQLTVEAWVRAEGEQVQWATVVDYWYDNRGFWLGGSTDPGGWEFWNSLDYVVDADGLVQNQWQHLAGVLDGDAGELVLYINGVEMDRWSGGNAFDPPPPMPLSIGARGDQSDYFLGTIDEVVVWSAVRTPEQICADSGGQWGTGGCNYAEPVGEPPGPCENEDCSGHGTCTILAGRATCACDGGYHAEGLNCVEDYDPCTDVPSKITEWIDWFLPGLEAGLEAEVQAFVDGWESGNSAWNAQAEGWTAAALLGLLHDSQEVFCLGVLEAVQADPENPVALANAAACMFELGYGDDARQFLDCSLTHAPENAATVAGQAYHEYWHNNDVEAALEKYEEAAAKDPSNPEWAYQAIQLAVELGDLETAARYLPSLPGPSQGAPNGWRGTLPTEEPHQDGGFCCPCDTPAMYTSISECTGNCSANLACFVGICAYTGTCQAQQPPFALALKICIPPSGLQVCFTFDTNGNFGVQVGASVFNGFLGAGVGFTYNPFNNQFNVVADVGTSNLPINTGASFTYNPSTGQASASVGVSDRSGAFSAQYTPTSN